MNVTRAAWAKTRAIARIEARSYLRSVALWVSFLLVLTFTLWTSDLGSIRTLELFLGSGQMVPFLLTAFVLVLLITAGIAREEREDFNDVWNSLPVRNTQQFWGKILGANSAALVFGIGFLVLIPLGWLTVGTVWTDATTSVASAYVAQNAGLLLFSVGIAGFLRGIVSNLRLRYVLGLLIVVGLAMGQVLGIDNRALWAVPFSPYMLGGIPYDQSLLFGTWPWTSVLIWHVIFQSTFSIVLLLLGRVMYERRRDPRQKDTGAIVVIALLLVGAIGSATLYMRYWNEARTTLNAQLQVDVHPGPIVTDHGAVVRRTDETEVRVLGYDLHVRMAEEGSMQITAALEFERVPEHGPWPLTLHHQWHVHEVHGSGVEGWSREQNFIWITPKPGLSVDRVVVEYEGRPILWDWQIGTINPIHFMEVQGGYLSPLFAWYPLPGQRRLATSVTDGQSRRWVWPTNERLLFDPVFMRLRWEGPSQLAVMSNLGTMSHREMQEKTQTVFQGWSDGISVLVGPMTRLEENDFAFIGAGSLIDGAESLAKPYDMLHRFYQELIGRPLPTQPVVAIPAWLVRFYNPYNFRLSVAAGTQTYFRVLTHLGGNPTVTEPAMASAIRTAEQWERTGSPRDLLGATSAIGYGLLQSLWGRPYTFQSLHENGVAFGLAQYTLMRWWEHVSGPEDFVHVRERIREDAQRQFPSERERSVQQVLETLINIEERCGDQAVRTLLGLAYDFMATQRITLDVFHEFAAVAMEDGSPGAFGRSNQ